MRSLLFFALFPPLTLAASSLCWLTARLGQGGRLAHRLECWWAGLALALAGVRPQADLSALDPAQTYVFMANHLSHFDILTLFWVLRRWNMRFVAKEELFRIPVFGPAMLRMGHVPILRENSRKAMRAIDQAADAAKNGLCVLIFPEGTRNLEPSRLGDFKIGGMIMALKCGLPVAPLILTGSETILPKGRLLPRGGQVRVKALPPLDPAADYTLKQRERFRQDMYERMSAAYQKERTCPNPA